MTTQFRTLHHICLVVHDIDKSQAYYESLGIGPWQDFPPLTELTDVDIPHPAAFAQMQYRFVNLDNVQIQLCQPPELPCAQRQFLDTRGEGVFHLGFEHNVTSAVAEGNAVGLDVLMRGQRPDGSGFVYFDTRGEAGVVLMNRQTPKPAV